MSIDTIAGGAHINREIYGHFIEHTTKIITDGLYVGTDSPIPNRNGIRLDILNAMKTLEVPLLHWPGGTTAEGYDWKSAVGPNRHPHRHSPIFGKVEDNRFGTHEFFDLCEYLGAEAYIVAGIYNNDVRDIQEWVQYITSSENCEMAKWRAENGRVQPWELKYLCIGNEWWFYSTAQQYAENYKRYSFAVKNFSDNPPQKVIFRGPHFWDTKSTYAVTDALDQARSNRYGTFDSMGMYVVLQTNCGGASYDFTDEQYFGVLESANRANRLLRTHAEIVRGHDTCEKAMLSIDEWGTWYKNSEEYHWSQASTMRDAIIAGIMLNSYNNHADIVDNACLCMSINCLHSAFQTRAEKLICTPTYDVMRMYKRHQNAELISTSMENDYFVYKGHSLPLVSCSASMRDQKLHITWVNSALDSDYTMECKLIHSEFTQADSEILTANVRDMNTVDDPDHVRACAYSEYKLCGDTLTVKLPSCSVVSITLS